MVNELRQKLLVFGFSEQVLDCLLNRDYNHHLIAQLYGLFTKENSGSEDPGLIAVERIRELIRIRYDANDVVKLINHGFGFSEIIQLSQGCLGSSQVLNLIGNLKKEKSEVFLLSKMGLSIPELTDLTVWGLPDYQVTFLKNLGLSSGDLFEIRNKGFKESELEEIAKSKEPIIFSFSGKQKFKGVLVKGEKEDEIANKYYEFVFRTNKGTWNCQNICALEWPINLSSGRKRVYLCHGNFIVGNYALPKEISFLKASGDKEKELDAVLIAHKL